MKSQITPQTAIDEDAIRSIHQRMIDAWNAGDGAAFATRLPMRLISSYGRERT
jgi:hypothetical protein